MPDLAYWKETVCNMDIAAKSAKTSQYRRELEKAADFARWRVAEIEWERLRPKVKA